MGRILHLAPRALGIAVVAFLALFSLDVLGQGRGWLRTLAALAAHLIPAAVVALALAVAWRWERAGAALFSAAGLLYLAAAWRHPMWVLVISGPLFALAALFVLDWLVNRPRGALHFRDKCPRGPVHNGRVRQPFRCRAFRLLMPVMALALPAAAERAELAAVGGGGVSFGEEQVTTGVSALGLSAGVGRRLQFDYAFHHTAYRLNDDRHFLTASYVVEPRAGRARPFVRAGAGVVHRRWETIGYYWEGPVRRRWTDTSLAVVVGTGATIDLGASLFLRPELRLYLHVGPTFTVLPAIAFGRRF